MKLISLNTWGGKVFTPLIDWIKIESRDTDIFCFQEIFSTLTKEIGDEEYRANLFQELEKVIPEFTGCFGLAQKGFGHNGPVDFELGEGLATFVRKSVEVVENKNEFVYGNLSDRGTGDASRMPRNMLITNIQSGKNEYTVFNVHGLWNGKGKTDSDDRLSQSANIVQHMNAYTGKKILCGDFNLLPNTESLKILEQGMRNLIEENSITSTRSSLYQKPEKFADYTLVSPEVEVKSFMVPHVDVSDHLPMILRFN